MVPQKDKFVCEVIALAVFGTVLCMAGDVEGQHAFHGLPSTNV